MAPHDKFTDILWLEEADSTNSELRRRLDSADNLSIISARSQTKGRGQGDHSWFSSPRTNLTFSILFRFPAAEGEPFAVRAGEEALLITCVTTLALRDYLLERGITARIKWPNDIWVGERKICGILIENILEGSFVRESIVGIGLDVNEENWPDNLPNPVSMKQLTGVHYNLDAELVALREQLCSRFETLGTLQGRSALLEEFNRYMFRLPEGQL